jgi:hypothetical protein
MSAALQEIETRISRLSVKEKQVLFDRLAQELRAANGTFNAATLAAMAADSDIQRELHEIEGDFAETAEDGLENL